MTIRARSIGWLMGACVLLVVGACGDDGGSSAGDGSASAASGESTSGLASTGSSSTTGQGGGDPSASSASTGAGAGAGGGTGTGGTGTGGGGGGALAVWPGPIEAAGPEGSMGGVTSSVAGRSLMVGWLGGAGGEVRVLVVDVDTYTSHIATIPVTAPYVEIFPNGAPALVGYDDEALIREVVRVGEDGGALWEWQPSGDDEANLVVGEPGDDVISLRDVLLSPDESLFGRVRDGRVADFDDGWLRAHWSLAGGRPSVELTPLPTLWSGLKRSGAALYVEGGELVELSASGTTTRCATDLTGVGGLLELTADSWLTGGAPEGLVVLGAACEDQVALPTVCGSSGCYIFGAGSGRFAAYDRNLDSDITTARIYDAAGEELVADILSDDGAKQATGWFTVFGPDGAGYAVGRMAETGTGAWWPWLQIVDAAGESSVLAELRGAPYVEDTVFPVGGAIDSGGAMLLAVQDIFLDGANTTRTIRVNRWLPDGSHDPGSPPPDP